MGFCYNFNYEACYFKKYIFPSFFWINHVVVLLDYDLKNQHIKFNIIGFSTLSGIFYTCQIQFNLKMIFF